jgi:acyl-CoA thioesterase
MVCGIPTGKARLTAAASLTANAMVTRVRPDSVPGPRGATVTTATTGDFDTDTRVEPVGPGVYAATLSERWLALGGVVNGGYLLAVCLQALRQDMPLPDPLVVSGYFLRPGTPGPAELRTEIARSGRRLASGEVRLCQDGRDTVRALASFTDLGQATGRTRVLAEPPALPPPEECVDPLAGRTLPGVTMVDRVRFRFARVGGWLCGEPSGDPRAEFWMGFADGRDADLLALALLVDAAAPVVMELGEAGSSTVELTAHLRARPAPGWLACRVATRHVIGGFHEEDFEIWDCRGTLVAQARQLAVLP